ncbi:TrbG/VirB9 family P-type conjugative transfer protein [Polymorphobacter sp. PAMC 29334]|uniref:TrbG/VirB9 family P-type conjugative transfer protein n=1 Tax=Polymorphobacter sp. PAMC 29334 TaxID=2862331 RepID=UPI001C66804F|nr:TrbG/VirB9 family P-type conjugative transfer protein [Polymorphobacter sp. PAMC 29334]QYE36302.1 TrbG/VirB9 family P-type conjugative transfer protein [Polymorphobacter sp. PAMC 29334]
MTIQRQIAPRTPITVGARSLPPWDRSGETNLVIEPTVGEWIVVGVSLANKLLGIEERILPALLTDGILRDARIVERLFEQGQTTFVCVATGIWSRLYLEPGETLIMVQFGGPGSWLQDTHGHDSEGRVCVRVRPMHDRISDDAAIVTDRRTYRLRLVGHPTKVTIACSWTHPRRDPRILTPAGEQRRWKPSRHTTGFSRRDRYIALVFGTSIQDRVLSWADALVPRRTWQLRKYNRLRATARVASDHPHPPAILDAVLARLLAVGTISRSEVNGWLPLPDRGGDELVEYFHARAKSSRRARMRLQGGTSMTPDDLLEAFPFVSNLPQTCYADAEIYVAASAKARTTVSMMGGMAPAAALFCAVAPRYMLRGIEIDRTLKQVAFLERMAIEAGLPIDLQDSRNVEKMAEHLLALPASGHLSEYTRFEILRALRLLINILRRYIRYNDPDDALGLRRFCPAEPSAVFTARMNRLGGELAVRSRENRKSRVLRHAGRLSQIEFAADLNLEQVVMTTRALASAEKAIDAADWIDVPVPLTIVGRRGLLLPGKQVCVWRVWDPLAYHRLLRSRTSARKEREGLDDAIAELEKARINGEPLAFIHEYRSTYSLSGSTPVAPFFVECWRLGLMARPASLPDRVIQKRFTVLQELRLPGIMAQKYGLLTGTRKQMQIWRLSMRQHRTVAYLDAFEHALRFAHLGFSSVIENLSRATAWIQQTQDRGGWEVRTLSGVKTAGFLAHDKQRGAVVDDVMSWFPVGTGHQAEVIELVAMTCRRCGFPDGLLPEIPMKEAQAWKRPDKRGWVFTYGDSVLSPFFLSHFLQFLLPGWGKITFHDLRHLGANAALQDGVPGWMIRLTLNHGWTDMWIYYAQQSAEQNRQFEAGFLRARFERSATARSNMARGRREERA